MYVPWRILSVPALNTPNPRSPHQRTCRYNAWSRGDKARSGAPLPPHLELQSGVDTVRRLHNPVSAEPRVRCTGAARGTLNDGASNSFHVRESAKIVVVGKVRQSQRQATETRSEYGFGLGDAPARAEAAGAPPVCAALCKGGQRLEGSASGCGRVRQQVKHGLSTRAADGRVSVHSYRHGSRIV